MSRFALVMKSTALCAGLSTVALVLLYHCCPVGWLLSGAITCGTVFYHFAMRLLAGTLVPRLTKSIPLSHPWFRQRDFEPGLYKRLHVRSWKSSLPTYDPDQFDLRKNTLSQVVRNMCNAELVHEVIILLSFLPLLFAIPFGSFPVFLITSLLAAMYDSVFVIAQRANRPRLVRILKKKEALRP